MPPLAGVWTSGYTEIRGKSEVRRVPVNEQWQPGNFQPSRQFQLPTYQTESDFGVPR